GPGRFTILNAFVISARNFSAIDSCKRKLRNRPRSTFRDPGLSIMLRPALPSGRTVSTGFVNAAVLNQAFVDCERGRLGSRNGLPMRSARSLLLPSTLVSDPVVSVFGVPLRIVAMADTDQPFKTVRTNRWEPLK